MPIGDTRQGRIALVLAINSISRCLVSLILQVLGSPDYSNEPLLPRYYEHGDHAQVNNVSLHYDQKWGSGVLQASYLPCVISGWCLISIQQISFTNQDKSTSSSVIHWI
jgi:hypothetical protein